MSRCLIHRKIRFSLFLSLSDSRYTRNRVELSKIRMPISQQALALSPPTGTNEDANPLAESRWISPLN